MRKETMNLIKNGYYGGSKYTADDFVKKLPFLKYLIGERELPVQVGIGKNDNWFWGTANLQLRRQLWADIYRIKKFAPGDTWYDNIMSRFETGDKYGIELPVPRTIEEHIDQKQYEEVCIWFNIPSRFVTSRKIAYKLICCKDRGADYSDAEFWDLLERLLTEPLNFAEYKLLNTNLYGSPEELLGASMYCSPEYFDTLCGLKSTLESYRSLIPAYARAYVNEIKAGHKAGKLDKAYEAWCSLYDLYEAPEGASAETRADLFNKLQRLMVRIPDEVVYDVTDWGKLHAVNSGGAK